MLSTLLNYRYYANDINKSLQRVQSTSTVEREAAYYKENIGNVKNVDDFLDDYRLYSYALKAYGLEDQIQSKGFIRKVLESDLTDKSSFANALADDRYREFAGSFSFSSTAVPTKPQSDRQSSAMIEAYSEHRVRAGTQAATKAAHFEKQIATVRTVDEFLNDSVLFEISMRSIGADPALISKSYVRDVITGVAKDNAASASDDKFFALADTLNFRSDGTVADGEVALDATGVEAMIHQYNVRTDNISTAGAAARETAYFESKVAVADTVDDLVGDERIAEYLKTAYILPSTMSAAELRNVLTSDTADPTSYINTTEFPDDRAYPDYAQRLRQLAEDFDFSASGAAPASGAVSAENRAAVTGRYHDNYLFEAKQTDDKKISAFQNVLSGRIKSVSDLLAKTTDYDTDAMEFALKAFDIDPATVSVTQVRRVLQSDVSDPNSYVNKLKDQRFVDLAAAFNFDSTGKIRAERVIQSTSDQTRTGTLYSASFGTDQSKDKQDLVRAETRRYLEEVAEIHTFDDFLENEFVTEYALTAYGLGEEDITADELRKIFTSDLGDPKSYANALGDSRYIDLVKAFNFDSSGLVKIDPPGVQSGYDLYSTQSLYLSTTLEQQVGETSEGARLALYFLRKAPEVDTTLGLLADKALAEVVRTALGLPDSTSQLDLDKQVALIEKRLDVKDFNDAKKLDKFIARFAALYDVENADPSASSPVLGLFSDSSSGSGILALL